MKSVRILEIKKMEKNTNRKSSPEFGNNKETSTTKPVTTAFFKGNKTSYDLTDAQFEELKKQVSKL